ncbi:MAG TPA: hypothetical protein DHV16_10120 [Nitrospiraceae bacterium]|nr:hypothetical protein [Nitrospiraceae bacterium]
MEGLDAHDSPAAPSNLGAKIITSQTYPCGIINQMELFREIRAFYIKLPYSYKAVDQEIVDDLWKMSVELPVNAIDITITDEVLIHSEIEFSLSNWNEAITYLRSALNALGAKSGYLIVRKVMALSGSLKTEIEGYKVTKRGVYNSGLPESADFILDVMRFSGRNKRLQQIDAMEKLFRFIEEKEKDTDTAEGG